MKAQEEVWGPNPDAGIASGIAFQQGRGVPADGRGGAARANGTSPRAPTIPTGACSRASCARATSSSTTCICLLPLADYEVVDDWHVLGMRATSSKTVRCKDVFVPAHRTISMYVSTPGPLVAGSRRAHQPALPHPDLGAGRPRHRRLPGGQRARGAGDRDRAGEVAQHQLPGGEDARFPDGAAAHRRGGREDRRRGAAAAQRRAWRRSELYEEGGTLDMETRLRYKRNCRAGGEALRGGGGLAARDGGRQRHLRPTRCSAMFRDAHAAAGHFSFSTDAQYTPWALHALGGEIKSPTL